MHALVPVMATVHCEDQKRAVYSKDEARHLLLWCCMRLKTASVDAVTTIQAGVGA